MDKSELMRFVTAHPDVLRLAERCRNYWKVENQGPQHPDEKRDHGEIKAVLERVGRTEESSIRLSPREDLDTMGKVLGNYMKTSGNVAFVVKALKGYLLPSDFREHELAELIRVVEEVNQADLFLLPGQQGPTLLINDSSFLVNFLNEKKRDISVTAGIGYGADWFYVRPQDTRQKLRTAAVGALLTSLADPGSFDGQILGDPESQKEAIDTCDRAKIEELIDSVLSDVFELGTGRST